MLFLGFFFANFFGKFFTGSYHFADFLFYFVGNFGIIFQIHFCSLLTLSNWFTAVVKERSGFTNKPKLKTNIKYSSPPTNAFRLHNVKFGNS